MRRFVLLDRDGTLVEERHYLSRPEDVVLLPGVPEALRALHGLGLGLLVVTNQSGVGRGYFSREDAEAVQHRLHVLLQTQGVTLDGTYTCYHAPQDGCPCRKPKPGLVRQAQRDWHLNPAACVVVGDKACDVEMGRAVGARTVLVRTGQGAAVDAGLVRADACTDDLAGAVSVIEEWMKEHRPAAYATSMKR